MKTWHCLLLLIVCIGNVHSQTPTSSQGVLSINAPTGTHYRILGRGEEGTVPAYIKLPPGRVDVILIRDGYAEQMRTVQVEENRTVYVQWDADVSVVEHQNPEAGSVGPDAFPSDFPSDSDVLRLVTNKGFKPIRLREERLHTPAGALGGTHLLLSGAIDDTAAELMLDTGTAMCAIARRQLTKFAVTEVKTSHRVRGALGTSNSDFFGKATLKKLTILYPLGNGSGDRGSINIGNVAALVADIPHVDGVFGLDTLRMTGSILDCKNQMLYVAPYGPMPRASEALRELLIRSNYTAIPLRLNANRQFDVTGFVNTVPSVFVIDTGSMMTCLDRSISQKAGVVIRSMQGTVTGDGTSGLPFGSARVNKLVVGSFNISNADVSVVEHQNSGRQQLVLLGIRQLSEASAVIDSGAATLYLK